MGFGLFRMGKMFAVFFRKVEEKKRFLGDMGCGYCDPEVGKTLELAKADAPGCLTRLAAITVNDLGVTAQQNLPAKRKISSQWSSFFGKIR